MKAESATGRTKYGLVVGCALSVSAVLLAGCAGKTVPPGEGVYKVGSPYRIKGKLYTPVYDPTYDHVGIASWYGDYFHGRTTANGETFDKDTISAAHKTLPLPSIVRVTNLENGRSVILRVNDRGPFVDDRVIDLSEGAAKELGYAHHGLTKVRVQFIAMGDAKGSPPVASRVRPRTQQVAGLAPAAARAPVPSPTPVPRAVAEPAAMPVAMKAAGAGKACVVADNSLFVQVGAFSDQQRASDAIAAVRVLRPLRVEPMVRGGQQLARIRIGPLADPATARDMLERVRDLGYQDAFLTTGGVDGEPYALAC